jgi:glycosyltransferase involved in cell wall biosynthesis
MSSTLSIRWNFDPQGNQKISFKYWRRQLTFVSAEETLRQVMNYLDEKKPGAYLRFRRADIDAALGIKKPGELPESLVQEVRKTFLFSWENVFKALHVECPALDIPIHARAAGISDREAIDRLNAVGACFLDRPVYSYTALARDGLGHPDVLEQFFKSLKTCQPILILKEDDARDAAIEKLAPKASIAVSSKEIYMRIDGLEEEILRAVASTESGFPVVVMAVGVAGRVLARRLMKRGFHGFLVDLDNLKDIPFEVKPVPRKSWLLRLPTTRRSEKLSASSGSGEKLPVRWEGPFLGHYSYSVINRELCSRLALNNRIDLSIRPSDTPFTTDPFNPVHSAGFRSIVDRVGRSLPRAAEVHIGNHAQHHFLPPREGRWVVIQPWDYMSLPVRWVDWIQNQIDEVWVPSSFVRSAFLEAGIPPERVTVVPNGVDVKLYRPNARKVKLTTRKSFKFLFVGGPFWRKGFDVLLEAYGKAFTARDDVTLVVKSAPEFWTSGGTKQLTEFRTRPGAPEIIPIVRSLDQVRMAGLYATCDCLVHPYRAEGFAMCVAEGMASSLPVIVTGRGGTTDFCNPRTAFLVPAKLRQMSKKQLDNEPTIDYPTYAEPELDGLVDWMRYVYEHHRESRAIAREGMNMIRREFTWDCAADIAAQRLAALKSKSVQRLVGR